MSRIDVALQTLSILQRDGLSREEIALRVNAIKVIEDVLNPKTVTVEKGPSQEEIENLNDAITKTTGTFSGSPVTNKKSKKKGE
jgi:hypothetical protein